MTGNGAREVLAIRYCTRTTTRAENFLNHHLYGEPDADIEMDYYFWVVRDGAGTILVDTGFNPVVGDRRRRAWWTTPADALPTIGVDPGSVHTIVVTHAHWDHTGNLHQFPDARIVISQAEYDFWTSPMARRSQFVTHAEPTRSPTSSARTRRGGSPSSRVSTRWPTASSSSRSAATPQAR